MKNFVKLFIFILLGAGSVAHAQGQPISIYGGIGTGREGLKLSQGSSSAEFGGWGAHGTAGIQIPFSKEFGLLADANYGIADLQNNANTGTIRENGTLTEMYAKAGFHISKLELGVGYGNSTIKTLLVSTSGTSTEAKYSGIKTLAYSAISFDIDDRARFQIYGEYSKGKLSDWTTNGFKITFNFYVLLPL
jgi:hypothetical protein